MKIKKQPTEEQYTALGKAIQGVFSDDYFNVIKTRRQFLWVNFLKGVVTGLGGVIGATVVVAIVIWLLNAANNIPFIGHFFQSTKDILRP